MEQIELLRGEIDNPLGGNWKQTDEDELQENQLAEFKNEELKEGIVVWYDDEDDVRPIKMSLKGDTRIKAKVSLPQIKFLESGLEVLLKTSKGESELGE